MLGTKHSHTVHIPTSPAAESARWYGVVNGVVLFQLYLRQGKDLFTHQRRYRHFDQSSRGRSWLALSRLATPRRCRKGRVMRCRGRSSVLP
jgi:hypothetical protein